MNLRLDDCPCMELFTGLTILAPERRWAEECMPRLRQLLLVAEPLNNYLYLLDDSNVNCCLLVSYIWQLSLPWTITFRGILVGELGLEPRRALRPAASKAAVFTNFTILPGTRSFNRRTIDNLVLGGELPRHRCTATCLPNRYRDGVYKKDATWTCTKISC